MKFTKYFILISLSILSTFIFSAGKLKNINAHNRQQFFIGEQNDNKEINGIHNYCVISRNTDGTYSLSDELCENCEEYGSDPCHISTDTDYSYQGMKVSQEDVDNENGIEILSYRNL